MVSGVALPRRQLMYSGSPIGGQGMANKRKRNSRYEQLIDCACLLFFA